MHLHDTSFRKSAVSTKARKDRRFTKNGLRSILNTQKSEKVRWGRGDLSGLFLLTTLSEPYLHGETAVKEICVRPMSIWWRRCVTRIFQVETHMDILNYPIAMAVTTTIVIEKILIQDAGFSLQYAPSIKTTGWKMLSCNSARPCVFVSCAVWRSVSLSWSLNAELSLAIAFYFQLLTLYHVWTSLSIYQL